MKSSLLILVLFTSIGNAYAASKMIDSPSQEQMQTPADQAQIIFLRVPPLAPAAGASIFDVTDGDPKYIGSVYQGKKLAYFVEPGDHKFMLVSEAAEFLLASVVTGKTYYVAIKPKMGMWKARFSLFPVRNGSDGDYQQSSESFQERLAEADFVENTDASIERAEANYTSIVSKQKKSWKKWEKKSADDIAERTLEASDGT
jgi:hypothetical protein